VGASAGDLLDNSHYQSVKIEIQYMPGYQPDAAAVDHLVALLNARLNKPGGITVIQKQIDAASTTILTQSEVTAIENKNRTVFTEGDQLGIYFLYTNGNFSTANVLGVAYKNTSMCLFGKTIQDNSGGVGQTSRTKLTATVLEHECGHILGLVNVGTAMQVNHIDAAHGHHCDNTSCLMYYASETTDILGFLLTEAIPSFDANCISDLEANGGK